MNIFVAGASGAVGRQLVPILVSGGHRVTAATRTPEKQSMLRSLGAEAVVMDALDREAVMRAVQQARPDAIVHQMTALARLRSLKNFDREFATTNRLRTEGTENLLAAARAAGTRIFVAQSYTGWTAGPGDPSRPVIEADPFDPSPPKSMARGLAAIRKLEALVTGAASITGIVLRYGNFHGPGTSFAPDAEFARLIRKRQFPIVGGGQGVWSFTHVEDAAQATVAAIERSVPGIYNIVDDHPTPVREWLPALAELLGARPPAHFPAWLARFAIGEAGVRLMTGVRPISNQKAKAVLAWKPLHNSWRDGFVP